MTCLSFVRRFISIAAICCLSLIILAGNVLAVDTSGLDNTTIQFVQQAERAALEGREREFIKPYEQALQRVGLLPQLSELERLYLENIEDVARSLGAHADYLARWKDPTNTELRIDEVLRRAAELLLLTDEEIFISKVRAINLAIDRILENPIRPQNEIPGAGVQSSEPANKRYATLVMCGRAAYSQREYSRAQRCFEEAQLLQAGTGPLQQIEGAILLYKARSRGAKSNEAGSAQLYDSALRLELSDSLRAFVLCEIALGEWNGDEQSGAAKELLEQFSDSPETLKLRKSGAY